MVASAGGVLRTSMMCNTLDDNPHDPTCSSHVSKFFCHAATPSLPGMLLISSRVFAFTVQSECVTKLHAGFLHVYHVGTDGVVLLHHPAFVNLVLLSTVHCTGLPLMSVVVCCPCSRLAEPSCEELQRPRLQCTTQQQSHITGTSNMCLECSGATSWIASRESPEIEVWGTYSFNARL